VGALGYGASWISALPAAAQLPLWLLYWYAAGSVMTGLWVLAHECGHGLLHSDLFVELWEHKKRTNSFEDSRRLITWRERNETVEGHFTKNSPDWWEYQANRMISSLLLPVFPLRAALRGWGHEPESLAAMRAWEDTDLCAKVRNTFEVSLAVARIRLERLYGGREV
jgi:Zn-dependent peptidase ImmA (M78 family)